MRDLFEKMDVEKFLVQKDWLEALSSSNRVASELYSFMNQLQTAAEEEYHINFFCKTDEVTDLCPHCNREVTLNWDIQENGLEVFCPYCGKRMMLCSYCPATHNERSCDYSDGSCFYSSTNGEKTFSFTQTQETDIGVNYDTGLDILLNNEYIGRIYTSDYDDQIFVEWVEITEKYRGKHYFRKILCALIDFTNKQELFLECSEELLPMYLHLGAKKLDYDDFREMYYLKLELNKKIYGTYPTYSEIKEDYKEIVNIMKSAKTFDDLMQIQKNYHINIQIDGVDLDEYCDDLQKEVFWVRVDSYGCLSFIYFHMRNNEFDMDNCSILFDVWSNVLEDEFLRNVKLDDETDLDFDYLTEQVYWNAVYPDANVLLIDPEMADKIQNMLKMDMEKISETYGYKSNELIMYTSKFEDGYDMNISLNFVENRKPYVQATILENGVEVDCSEWQDVFTGEWVLLGHKTIIRPKNTEFVWKDIVLINGTYYVEEFPISGQMDTLDCFQIDDFLEAVAMKYEVDVDDIKTYSMDGVLPDNWQEISYINDFFN